MAGELFSISIWLGSEKYDFCSKRLFFLKENGPRPMTVFRGVCHFSGDAFGHMSFLGRRIWTHTYRILGLVEIEVVLCVTWLMTMRARGPFYFGNTKVFEPEPIWSESLMAPGQGSYVLVRCAHAQKKRTRTKEKHGWRVRTGVRTRTKKCWKIIGFSMVFDFKIVESTMGIIKGRFHLIGICVGH